MNAAQKRMSNANRVQVSLKPEVRHAIAQEMNPEEMLCGSPEVQPLVLEAMKARGWTPERMRKEYLRYVLSCDNNDEENFFPGGKV